MLCRRTPSRSSLQRCAVSGVFPDADLCRAHRRAACRARFAGLAAAAPPQSRLAAETNFTKAKRPRERDPLHRHPRQRGVVPGTVAWLQNPRAHASANFVVGREGEVQQLVPLHDIAWHAGNWAYNVRSVGIENVGFTGDPAGFTTREYQRGGADRGGDRAPVRDPDRPASHHRPQRGARLRTTRFRAAASTTTPIRARTGSGAVS